METKFKNFKHFNKFKYPYKNYKYQANKSKDDVKETVKDTAMVKVSDKLADPSWQEDFQKLKTNLISMIELKTKYYIDQRMGILINGNSLYTRGYCSLNILDDFSHGGKSLVYKNNGNPVVTMTQDGYIYCKNIFLNGLNVYEMFQNIFNDFSEGGSIYVKHIDLKNGLYDMDINSSIMKHLKVQPDVNNYLEVFKDNNNAMVMNTTSTVGYSMFKPNMTNDETVYGLRFGKDDSTGANIRYTYSTTAANQYLAMGPIGKADTLNIYNDRRVIINCNYNQNALFCKYDGTLSNNQYIDSCIGDDAFTAIIRQHGDHSLRIGMKKNSNNVYGTVRMYRTNIGIRDMEFLTMFSTQTSGSGIYLRMERVAEGDPVNIAVGKTGIIDKSAVFGYVHSNSNPLGYMALFNEPIVITFDKNGNMNMNGLTAASSISCNGFYSSDFATVDGVLACTQLDVANTTKNTWYAKLRVEDYLSNGDYIRMIFKDLGGQANIDLFHDTQYYGLKLQVPTANLNDNKLCIYPTGVTIDGQVDMYNDANVWGNLEIGSELKINSIGINNIAISTDVNDNSKINDNTIATTAYIKNSNANTSIHQEIPNNPYASIAITDNPYLKWSINSIGNYNTNTNALCYSEELHQFVIVGNNGYTYFSYDGFTWMSNSMNAFTWTGVTYGPTYGYIACTSSNMFLLSSTDGRTWVPHNNVAPGTGRAITYGNTYYAIVPDGSNVSYLSYTTNPTVSSGWGSFWLGSSGKWYNIAYSKFQHKFLIVGASGKHVSCDDEFTSGSRVTGQFIENTKECHGVCYSEKLNLWIIAVNDSSYCYVSQDGNTFTQATLPYQTSWHRVIWGNDRFIMTSSGSSSAAYSLDGTNWYPFDVSTIGAYSSWLGLAYGNGLFVLSGNNNTAPLNSLVATYTLPNSYITPRAMMQQIYPIGSIYISMININPGVIFGGSWTEIQNRFLYCVPTTLNSGNTGGSDRHNHPLSDNGYACIATHGAGNIVVRERTTPAWPANYKMTTGSYETAPATDSYGQCLRGNTDNASSLPPYITVYAWYRYA